MEHKVRFNVRQQLLLQAIAAGIAIALLCAYAVSQNHRLSTALNHSIDDLHRASLLTDQVKVPVEWYRDYIDIATTSQATSWQTTATASTAMWTMCL